MQSIPYVGYFNSSLCYAYNYDDVEANRYFYPVSNTTTDASGNAFSCAGQSAGTPSQSLWSGNFMNWASMQAIDTFRLALTGGYRVNRPGDGTPSSVSITGSDGNAATKSVGDWPSVTYLEKATTDRWTNPYTDSRSLFASVTNATPSSAPVSSTNAFRTRVGGLRNQMWFMPYSSSKTDLGSWGGCCSATNAIDLPVSSTTQTESTRQPSGATRNTASAIPYNPTYDTLPNLATANNTNSTPCGTSPIEYGCTTATWNCPYGGTAPSGTCSAQSGVTACTGNTYPYYRSADKQCHSTNADTGNTASTSNLAVTCTSTSPAPTISNANSGTKNQTTCALATYAGTAATYAHPGRDLIYSVSVRVRVCDGTWDTRDMCTKYGSYYKPEGLLQKNATKTRYSLFSYLTENDSNSKRVGGVMRARQKLIGPVISGEKPYPERTGRSSGIDNPEWDPATGVFINDPDSIDSGATTTKIGGCATSATPDGSGCVVQYSGVINYINRFGELGTGLGSSQTTYTSDPLSTLKAYDNLSELYYSAVSYLRGLGNNAVASNLQSTSGYTNSGTFYYQNADGFPVIEDWYKNGANQPVTKWNSTTPAITVGKPADPILYSCQTSAVLGIGDTNTNSESNAYSSDTSSTMGGSAGPFSASVLTTWLSYLEGTAAGKNNIAALGYWGHLNDLRADVPNTDLGTGKQRGQTITTYWVDVVEKGDYKTNTTNQYYNVTKYGGFNIPAAAWDGNGNATQWDGGVVPSLNWFTTNQLAWTTQTTTSPGGYYQPSDMYFANNGANMIAGLNAAFTKIQADASGSGASLAANSTQLNTGTTTFQARYFSSVWAGDLTAYAVGSTGAISTASLWSAASLLPTTVAAAQNRVIKTTTDGTASGVVDFNASIATSSPLRTAALGSSTTIQNSVINYLRGDPSTTTFRSRTTALGDIVDSQPVFVGASDPNIFYGKTFTGSGATYATFAAGTTSRKKRIWVAANDGMVHGFNAECTINSSANGCANTTPLAGAEIFAYLPKAVILGTGVAAIKNLTDPQYGSSTVPHQYFNDGELTVADVYFTSDSKWHTVLVGTTGRGPAKAIYALDITDPTTTPSLLWEKSATDSNYIGQMIGKPIIAQTADGVWSVLIGNGYNSANNTAALLQFAISDGTLTVHTTNSTANNGLAAPAVWLANPTNGISTEAYAGDLMGNVWQFNLSGTTGTIVFTAKDSSSTPKAQPITAGMLIGKDPATSNVWLFFGTGRYLTQTDLSDKSVQTWYGIIVEGTNAVSSSSTRSSLVQRTIAGETTASGSTVAARAITPPTAGDISGRSGWYMDLQYGTAAGERMVTPNQFQGSLLLGTTRIPTSADPCNPSGSGWVMVISPFTGAPPSSSFFDVNSNGTVGTDDLITIGGVTYVAAGIGFAHAPNNPIFVGNSMLLSFDDASTRSYNTAGNVGILKRLTWRELVTQ